MRAGSVYLRDNVDIVLFLLFNLAEEILRAHWHYIFGPLGKTVQNATKEAFLLRRRRRRRLASGPSVDLFNRLGGTHDPTREGGGGTEGAGRMDAARKKSPLNKNERRLRMRSSTEKGRSLESFCRKIYRHFQKFESCKAPPL